LGQNFLYQAFLAAFFRLMRAILGRSLQHFGLGLLLKKPLGNIAFAPRMQGTGKAALCDPFRSQ
jgi:hypothetical protein